MKRIFTDAQVYALHKQYMEEKLSTLQLAEQNGCSAFAIQKSFKRLNLAVRNAADSKRKNTINKLFFNVIDTEEKAYFLGLLFADGSNLEKKSKIRIGLLNQDIDILKKFSNIIYGKEILYNFPSCQNMTYMVISSKEISQDLARHGCVQNKTFLIEMPKLAQPLVSHFVRGYYDGDGSLSYSQNKNGYKKFYCSITSTKELLNSFQTILKNIGVNSKFSKRWKERNNNIVTLNIYGNRQIDKFLTWLYKDSSTFLYRKFFKYKELSRMFENQIG